MANKEVSTVMDFLSSTNKLLGKDSKTFVKNPLDIVIEKFPTGSYLLDQELKGGWAKGTIIELFGENQSGKTTTAIHAVAEHQKKYPDEPVLWIDLEKVFDPEYFQKIGINIDSDKFILARPQGGENTWEVIINFVKTFGKGIVILDSYSLLLPKKEDEGMMGDAQMGAAARMNSQGLRKIFPYMDMGGTTIFALNQIRSSIGGYGDPNVTTGGKGLPFYARTRIKTSASKGLAGEYAVHKFNQVKSNYGMKDRVTETTIVYGEGFNLVKEILVAAISKNIIQKSGSWFSYNGDKLGQGMDNIAQLLEDNPELFEEIEYKVRNTATVEQEEYIEEDELEV